MGVLEEFKQHLHKYHLKTPTRDRLWCNACRRDDTFTRQEIDRFDGRVNENPESKLLCEMYENYRNYHNL